MQVLILFLVILFHSSLIFADETKNLRFGVLSFRPKEITTAQWQPLTQELEKNLSGYHIELIPLTFPEFDKAVKDKPLDFILTNPEHYILLKNRIGINAVATIITLEKGHPTTQFSGVIFTRTDKTNIQTLDDLNNKIIASPSEESLGGYLMQRWELEKNNVQPKAFIFTGMPHDKVVNEVLAGNVDAGFVRSGVLEKLEQSGKVQLGENSSIRVLAPHAITDGISVLHSTDHYPEWAFSVTKNIDPDIAKRVALTLLNIKLNSEIAKTAGIAGFNAPADYTSVEILMLRLRSHPDELKYFNFFDVLWRYKNNAIIGMIITVSLLGLIIFLIHTNRKLRKTEIELHESNAEISLLLNSMAEGAYGVDNEGFCRFVNQAFLTILGYDNANEIIGQHVHELIHHSHADGTHYPSTECKMYNAYRQQRDIHVTDEVFWRKDGVAVPVEYWSKPIISDGAFIGAIATFSDITRRQKYDRELQESRNRLQTILETNPECIQIVDKNGKVKQINSAGLEMLEADSFEQVINTSLLDNIVPEYREQAKELHQRVIKGESVKMQFEIIGFKGAKRWVESNSVPMKDNGDVVRLSVTRDITEHKKYEATIKQLAFFDSLTNLPNRRNLLDRLHYLIALSHRQSTKFAVLMMDLDKFKAVNDKLGHRAGDDLLKQVAERTLKQLRDTDMVARLGGDEFVLVLESLNQIEDSAQIATKVIADLTKSFTLENNQVVEIGASIGISFYPQHGVTPEILIDRADSALYQAKENGRGCFAYYENEISVLN